MLQKVLESDTFARSERARKLLKYLVEQEQDGEGERLKGTSVAIDVFGRDAEFDPSTDAVVRVQAGRLRDLLAQYYKTEGASDPLKICIQRGSYVPTYLEECPTDEPHDEVRAAERRTIATLPKRAASALRPATDRFARHIQLMWVSMAAVVVAIGIYLAVTGLRGPSPSEAVAGDATAVTASIPTRPPEELPSVRVLYDHADAAATSVAELAITGLSGFDTVFTIVPPDGTGYSPVGPLDFDFNVASPTSGQDVSIELSHAASGKVLLSRSIPATGGAAGPSTEDRIADVLTSTIPVSGVLYQEIETSGLQHGLTACLLLNDDYYLAQDEAKHLSAYRCLEDLAASGAVSPIVYSELASLHLEAVTDGYAYPPDATADEAFVLARRAVKSGAASPYAHRALGFVYSGTGNSGEGIRWMRKAYELNTYDLTIAASLGYAQVFASDYAGGEPVLARAVESTSAHPTWWDYGLFLARFMLDDHAGAARAASALVGVKRQHYLGAQIIVAHAAGDVPRTAALTEELRKTYPRFFADPVDALIRANYPAEVADRFGHALRNAGVGSAF
ncbi:MAG: tetratricopeptide repeat protein [Rhizobiaceae bacterium]